MARPGAYEHRVVAWDEVGEDEGTGIVHIAPGCGAEDFALGKSLGLPMLAPLDEDGRSSTGFGFLTGRDVRDSAEPVVEHLKQHGLLLPPGADTSTATRTAGAAARRSCSAWSTSGSSSMGPVYDAAARPAHARSRWTPASATRSWRSWTGIRWIPGFGYERELDWLLNMHDWMISKKRYWGLALPIYDCAACGTFDVVSGRDELRARAVEGWDEFEGHTPHRPYVDAVKIACRTCGAPVARIAGRGQPLARRRHRAVLDAPLPRGPGATGSEWFPADFVTESFPGQFRNWFYSMLAMSTVLRREAPFRTIFGYATLFGEDGRPMHKSWGNAIEFDEAAERMGVDVMRWMYAKARPDDNILFGWHAADEARRELLVLWNVYAFFVTLRAAGRLVARRRGGIRRPRRSRRPAAAGPLDPVARWPAWPRASRTACADYDPDSAARSISGFIDELSTWYLRRNRQPLLAPGRSGGSRRGVRHAPPGPGRPGAGARAAAALPDRGDATRTSSSPSDPPAPDSVHLTALAGGRAGAAARPGAGGGDRPCASAPWTWSAPSAPRPGSGRASRSPACGSRCPERPDPDLDALLELIADEVNVKDVEPDRRRVGARGTARQAAPAEDRPQARRRRSRR